MVEVYDARALRVIVEDTVGRSASVETAACYALLDAVHKLWRPLGRERDDYLANPKPSGYRALHTAVLAMDGCSLEVQIRTRESHEDAEFGRAAHANYKDSLAKQQPAVDTLQRMAATVALAAIEPLARSLRPFARPVRGAPARLAADAAAAEAWPHVRPGTPLLRIAGGHLSDAVVVDSDATRLLVAVRFGARAGDYDALLELVTSSGWGTAGMGNHTVRLEDYRLCTDGRYHRLDAYGRREETTVEARERRKGTTLLLTLPPARCSPLRRPRTRHPRPVTRTPK